MVVEVPEKLDGGGVERRERHVRLGQRVFGVARFFVSKSEQNLTRNGLLDV